MSISIDIQTYRYPVDIYRHMYVYKLDRFANIYIYIYMYIALRCRTCATWLAFLCNMVCAHVQHVYIQRRVR